MLLSNPSLTFFSFPYPFLITNELLEIDHIDAINLEHSQLFESGIETWDGGQESRDNIVITRQNSFFENNKDSCPRILKFFNHLDSSNFRSFLFNVFSKYLHPNGFIGKPVDAFMKSSLELQLCRSIDGYENPIHVDTRKRIVHALIYLNHKDLSGGEFDLFEHTRKSQCWDYAQFPATCEIKNIYRFEPNNNKSIFILSTPNSYHRGAKSKGIRNFLYIGYNYHESAWKSHNSWNNPKSFSVALKKQKADEVNFPLPKYQLMDLIDGRLKCKDYFKMDKPTKSNSIGTPETLLRGLAS